MDLPESLFDDISILFIVVLFFKALGISLKNCLLLYFNFEYTLDFQVCDGFVFFDNGPDFAFLYVVTQL
jgi:hypothetical protein